MNTYKILLLGILIVFSACMEETEVELRGDLEEKLVVDIRLTNDTGYYQAILSTTAYYYLEEQTPRVSGADIRISSTSGELILFEEIAPGLYQTTEEVYGKIDEEYFLEIEYDGELYESASKLRRNATIDSIYFRWEMYLESYRVMLFGHDPPGKGDFYLWHIYKNGELMTDSLHKVMFGNDEYIDGQCFQGMEIDMWFNDFDLQLGDTVMVEMHGITKEAYNFIMEVFFETGGAGPAASSGKTPRGNISNEAFGLFYTASIVRGTAIIDENVNVFGKNNPKKKMPTEK